MVLVESKQFPRTAWPIAEVTRILPGRDRRIRAVEVLINGLRTRRAVNNLIPLEVSKIDDNLQGGVCEGPLTVIGDDADEEEAAPSICDSEATEPAIDSFSCPQVVEEDAPSRPQRSQRRPVRFR